MGKENNCKIAEKEIPGKTTIKTYGEPQTDSVALPLLPKCANRGSNRLKKTHSKVSHAMPPLVRKHRHVERASHEAVAKRCLFGKARGRFDSADWCMQRTVEVTKDQELPERSRKMCTNQN